MPTQSKIFQGCWESPKPCLIPWNQWYTLPLLLQLCLLTGTWQLYVGTASEPHIFGLLQAEPGGLYPPQEIQGFPASDSCCSFLGSYTHHSISGNIANKWHSAVKHLYLRMLFIASRAGLPCCGRHWWLVSHCTIHHPTVPHPMHSVKAASLEQWVARSISQVPMKAPTQA